MMLKMIKHHLGKFTEEELKARKDKMKSIFDEADANKDG
jgi:hypothetical protein